MWGRGYILDFFLTSGLIRLKGQEFIQFSSTCNNKLLNNVTKINSSLKKIKRYSGILISQTSNETKVSGSLSFFITVRQIQGKPCLIGVIRMLEKSKVPDIRIPLLILNIKPDLKFELCFRLHTGQFAT